MVSNSSTFTLPNWESNSAALTLTLDDSLISILYFVIALGVAILVHSYILNKRKYHLVRICTEVATFFTIIQVVVALQCPNDGSCSLMTNLILKNIVANSLCGAITQGCENLITFN